MGKRPKDPDRPKRPTSAYFYYVAGEREAAKKRGEHISRVAEWTKQVSAGWRELTDSQKKPFDVMAAKDKQRYENQMANYKGGKKPKDANKPKRAQSAYFLFLADFRAKQKANFQHDGGHKDLIRAAGEAWNKLSETEKAPYQRKHEEERKKYEVAMAAYAAGGSGAGSSPAKRARVEVDNGAVDDDDDDDEEDDDEEEESD